MAPSGRADCHTLDQATKKPGAGPGFLLRVLLKSASRELHENRVATRHGHGGVEGSTHGNEGQVEFDVDVTRVHFHSLGGEDAHVGGHVVTVHADVRGADRVVENLDDGLVAFITNFSHTVIAAGEEGADGKHAEEGALVHEVGFDGAKVI